MIKNSIQPSLTAYHLQVICTASETIELNEYIGSAIRGAFVEALYQRFEMNDELTPSEKIDEREKEGRWRDAPRPYAIRPPAAHKHTLTHGEKFSFGITLFDSSITLSPYVIMALRMMSREGIGRKVEANGWRRGRFIVNAVHAINLFTAATQSVYTAESNRITMPLSGMTYTDAEAFAAHLPEHITLQFLTPTRLKSENQIVQQVQLSVLVARLMERHDALSRIHNGTAFAREEREQFLEMARDVDVLNDNTYWTDVRSYSNRQRKKLDIGGNMGDLTLDHVPQSLAALLAWGTVLQVGKSATKGNGVYVVHSVGGD